MKTLRIYLHGKLDAENITEAIKSLTEGEQDTDINEVVLYINSNGGSISPAFAICNLLEQYSKPLTAVAVRNCGSSAMMILQSAPKRACFDCTRFLIHRSSNTNDEPVSIPENQRIIEKSQEIEKIFLDKTFQKSSNQAMRQNIGEKNHFFFVQKKQKNGVSLIQ